MKAATTLVCALSTALAVASCGGGGSSGSSGSSNTTSGKAATPREAFGCLQGAGVAVKSTSPPNDSIISELAIDGGKPDQVLVWFANNPKTAKNYAGDAASFLSNAGGNADVVARTVVVGTSGKANAQLDQIEGCLTS